MFKKFLQRIIDADNKQDAIDHVYYGETGIERAYDRELITYKEYEMLSSLIEKMA